MINEFFEGMDKKQIGAYIKRERIARGYSVSELGKAINISHSTINTWEAGKSAPKDEDTLKKLLHFYRDHEVLPSVDLQNEFRKRHWWTERFAKLLGVSIDSVYRWIRNGEININYRRKVAQVLADEPSQKYDIKSMRKKLGVSLESVAEYMNVSAATIKVWESCRARPNNEELDKLLAYYNERERNQPAA